MSASVIMQSLRTPQVSQLEGGWMNARNAAGLCRSLDSSHGEEISEQTTFAVKGL
jgi:hypothetical protein